MSRLSAEQFQRALALMPLVSIDLVIDNGADQILLGQRVNRPAKGFWFVPGGRILKGEKIEVAKSRILKDELGWRGVLPDMDLIGVFDHLYEDDAFAGPSSSSGTHYVALGFRLTLSDILLENLPKDQHRQYRLFSIPELLEAEFVHDNTKLYFSN